MPEASYFGQGVRQQPPGDATNPEYQSPASSWNGRTSIGSVVARAALRPHSRAESRSAALMIKQPPTCSFPSANGPSVTSTSPSRGRSTVAVLDGYSPPLKTQAPAAL